MQTDQISWIIAGCCSLFATFFVFYQIRSHLLYNSYPYMKRYTVRILLMIPIYALSAWFGLRYDTIIVADYMSAVRDCYESVVIYSFLMFLVHYFGGEHDMILLFRNGIENFPVHFFPFWCCFKNWTGEEYYKYCKRGTLQYVIIKPIAAIFAFIFRYIGIYEEGKFYINDAYPYIALINNLSQTWAIYCLIMFYLCTRDHLKHVDPVSKFLCIKSIIFFTFWQGVILAILVKFNQIPSFPLYSVDNVAIGIQNFAICIELVFFSFWHHKAFPVSDFRDPSHDNMRLRMPLLTSLWDSISIKDIYYDANSEMKGPNNEELREQDDQYTDIFIASTDD